MLALSAAYALRKGPPPVGHYTRLTLGDQIPENTIRRASTPDLVAFTMTQSAPWNQLAARGELCRRITGRAATHFWYQPICLPDAMYNWIGQTWTDAELTRLTDERPPQLIVWGNARTWPLDSLAGYSVYSGFAIRADQRDRQGTSQTKD